MDAPRLRWTLRLGGSAPTRLVNGLLPRLPAETYRRQPALARVRSVSERALGPGPGDPVSSGTGEPQVSGQPKRLFLVDDAQAELDGVDLGRPLGFEPGTDLGTLQWPALGALVEREVLPGARGAVRILELAGGSGAPVFLPCHSRARSVPIPASRRPRQWPDPFPESVRSSSGDAPA